MSSPVRVTKESLDALNTLLNESTVSTDYAESLIAQERVHVFQKELARQHMPQEWDSAIPESDEDWEKFVKEVARTSEKMENSGDGLHSPQKPSMELPMNRFLTVSSAEDPQPWIARREMEDSEILEGDMMSAAARTALYAQTNTAATDGDDSKLKYEDILSLSQERSYANENERLSTKQYDGKMIDGGDGKNAGRPFLLEAASVS